MFAALVKIMCSLDPYILVICWTCGLYTSRNFSPLCRSAIRYSCRGNLQVIVTQIKFRCTQQSPIQKLCNGLATRPFDLQSFGRTENYQFRVPVHLQEGVGGEGSAVSSICFIQGVPFTQLRTFLKSLRVILGNINLTLYYTQSNQIT